MNTYYTLHRYPINFVLGYSIAAAPDPVEDYCCPNHSILKLKQRKPRLNQPRIFCSDWFQSLGMTLASNKNCDILTAIFTGHLKEGKSWPGKVQNVHFHGLGLRCKTSSKVVACIRIGSSSWNYHAHYFGSCRYPYTVWTWKLPSPINKLRIRLEITWRVVAYTEWCLHNCWTGKWTGAVEWTIWNGLK